MKKNYKLSGFTLIELMIVIVILGILMGTILPRISGAQSRARDTARITDLNTIAQVLELYYDDFGSYPAPNGFTGSNSDRVCLNDGGAGGYNFKTVCPDCEFREIFETYFKGDKVPQPPQKEVARIGGGANCTNGYLYLPLKKSSGQPDTVLPSHFVLIANVETATKGNALNVVGTVTYDPAMPAGAIFDYKTTQDFKTVQTAIDAVEPINLADAEEDDPSGVSTMYILLN